MASKLAEPGKGEPAGKDDSAFVTEPQFLKAFETSLRIDTAIKKDITREVHTHLEDKSRELQEAGFSEKEATKLAIESFGLPESVAGQIYRVHAQGTWQEVFLAILPHVLAALLFASYYWQNLPCLSIILMVTTCVVIYGWGHGKPTWFFPWLGYYLLPVIIAGVLLLSLPSGWTWLGVLAYMPLALFAIAYIVRYTVNRDWLYVSAMVVPLSVAFAWLLALSPKGELPNMGLAQLQSQASWIAISFMGLAMATGAFIRVKQRWEKALALLVPSTIILGLVAITRGGAVNFWGWLGLAIAFLALISPAWLELKTQ